MLRLFPLFALAACPTPESKDTGDTADTSDPIDIEVETDVDTDTDGDTDVDTDTDTDVDTHLYAGFEALLDTTGACSDTWAQAWDADGITGLELYRRGLLEAAIAANATVEETLDLATGDIEVYVVLADPVAINYCTDALSEQREYNRYFAVAGTAVLRMDPPASEYAPGILDVELTDVEFTTDYGHEVSMPAFTMTDVNVIQEWGG